ncbi:MAG: hypothetical protein GVY12_06525 [Bacteroidetes bacterium]|jgi:hypothetical protein|nr:hypothetical protein [Bacteroidota bacterium]
MNRLLPTFLVALLTLLIAGAGYYVTTVRQPAQLQQVQAPQGANTDRDAMTQLLAQAATSADRAEETVRKWEARYRYIPDTLSTPDIVEYLDAITASNYEAFNVQLADVQRTPDINWYVFDVSGTASYRQLYDFVWQIENNPAFYRIQGLNVARTIVAEQAPGSRRQERNMVRFDLTLEAYFGGREGLSTSRERLAKAPPEYLPARTLPHNSFYPLVQPSAASTPDDDLLSVETAQLVSIAGSRAIFQDGNTQYLVYEGTSIRNGSIVKIDPINVVVRARLQKDGRNRVVDLQMETEDPEYRQAAGEQTRLVPIETQADTTARR